MISDYYSGVINHKRPAFGSGLTSGQGYEMMRLKLRSVLTLIPGEANETETLENTSKQAGV